MLWILSIALSSEPRQRHSKSIQDTSGTHRYSALGFSYYCLATRLFPPTTLDLNLMKQHMTCHTVTINTHMFLLTHVDS